MKAFLQQFLGQRPPFSGLAAWGARLPDRTLANGRYTDWFTGNQIERILGQLALAAESVTHPGVQPRRMAWTFEHARVHFALRPDGACLALFVENRPDLPTSALDSILEAFVSELR